MSRHLKLVDRRSVGRGMVRELRSALRGIDSGEIVSMAVVYVRRDGSIRTKFDCESPIKALGSVDLLKDYIRTKSFELS